MSTPVRFIVYALLAIVAIFAGVAILKAALGLIWSLVLPVAIIGVIGYVAYSFLSRKSLGGGPRSLR